MDDSPRVKPYAPRTYRFYGLLMPSGTRVKLYSITEDESDVEWARFESGIDLAFRELPAPPGAEGRPGLGFIVAHQTSWIDYLVLGWWDRENELPLRIFVRERGSDAWRPAHGSESVCVWDLEVIWSEREAYVQTVLAGVAGGGSDAYLERHAGTPAPPLDWKAVSDA
jgi:hypothetical protein